MTAWILVALAIAAALIALCAALLLRRATAMTALAVTAACFATAFDQLHETWAVAIFAAYTVGFVAVAAMYAVRKRLPPYVVGSDDEEA